jgi:hypothetical protein
MKQQRQTFSFGLRSWLAACTIFAAPTLVVLLGRSLTRVDHQPAVATKIELPSRAERVPNLARDGAFAKPQSSDAAMLRGITFKQPTNQESRRAPGVQSAQAQLVLTTIMSTRDGAVAVIGGKVCRTGDSLDAGWKIDKIDPTAGVVELTGHDGSRTSISLRSTR